jgi:hypothetical protein
MQCVMTPPSFAASYSDLTTIIKLRNLHNVIFQSEKNIF